MKQKFARFRHPNVDDQEVLIPSAPVRSLTKKATDEVIRHHPYQHLRVIVVFEDEDGFHAIARSH